MGPCLPGPGGDPSPRPASLYLHKAEPQQLSQESSTATPRADMAPACRARRSSRAPWAAHLQARVCAHACKRARARGDLGSPPGGESVNQILGTANVEVRGSSQARDGT